MKRSKSLILGTLLMSLAMWEASLQGQICSAQGDAVEESAAPVLGVSDQLVDFGEIRASAVPAYSVRIENRGKQVLAIQGVYSSCTCTSASIRDSLIKPDESTFLDIKLIPATYPASDLSSVIRIQSNDPVNGDVAVLVKARILPEFTVEPSRIDFGIVKKGRAETREVIIYAADGVPLVIRKAIGSRSVEVSFHQIQEADRETSVIPSRDISYRVWVSLKPETSTGRINESLSLQTNMRRTPQLVIPVTGRVVGVEFAVNPSVMILGSIKPGSECTPVEITGTNDLEIPNLESDLPALELELNTLEPSKRYAILARVKLDAAPGIIRGFLYLTLKEGDLIESARIGVFGKISR